MCIIRRASHLDVQPKSAADFTLFVSSGTVAVTHDKCLKQDILFSECAGLFTRLRCGCETFSLLIFFGRDFAVCLMVISALSHEIIQKQSFLTVILPAPTVTHKFTHICAVFFKE